MQIRTSRAVACVMVAGAALPAIALANGGTTIAGAPVVPYSQPQSGDTAIGSASDNSYGCHAWWLLHVIAGDHIMVNFDGTPSMVEELYPAGTNDDNFTAANPLPASTGSEQVDADSTGRGQAKYVVPRNGTLPLSFSAGSCGGAATTVGNYDFTVYDLHALILSASRVTDPRTHTTTVSLSAHNGDGEAVSVPLTVKLERPQAHHWIVTGTGTAPATFAIRWKPALRGSTQHIRLVVSGDGYWTTTKHVTVAAR